MAALSDSACRDGSAHFTVVVWNAEHTARKVWKNCATREEAELTLAALHIHKFEAEILPVGEAA